MGRVVALAALLLASCSMYGAKPDPMGHPRPEPVGKDKPVVEKVTPIEDCPVDFHHMIPKGGVKRDPMAAGTAVQSGDRSIKTANEATEPERRVDELRAAIEQYKHALVSDPYSSHATLQLAVAYDRVYRKGCALELLRRLYALANHPDFQADATNDIDRIEDNKAWFKDYRSEAMKAVGR